MGFFSKRKAAADTATSDVEAWMRTADEASEHDALDMVDVDAALGGVTPSVPAPPAHPASPELTTFDPSTVADQYRRADDDASMWHFPELDVPDPTEETTPHVDRRAPRPDDAAAPADANVSPAPSVFDMLAGTEPQPTPEVELEDRELVEGWDSDEGPLGNVALTAGGGIEDAWATFDSLSPAPESDALDDLWGSKKERRKPIESTTVEDVAPNPEAPTLQVEAVATNDPFAPIDHLLPGAGAEDGASDAAISFEPAAWQVPGRSPVESPDTPDTEDEAPTVKDFAVTDFAALDAADFDGFEVDESTADDIEQPAAFAAIADAEAVEAVDEVIDLDPVYGPLPVPDTDQTRQLLDILGLEPGTDWTRVRRVRGDLIAAHDPALETDDDRIELATEIRGEINSAYAALRLLFVA